MTFNGNDSELIKRIYSAGNDPQKWDAIVSDFFRLMGCNAGLATLIDLHPMELVSSRVYGPNSASFAQAIEEYSHRFRNDPTLRWASTHPGERCCDSRQTLPQGEHLDDPFVRWSSANFGSTHWFLAFTPPTEHLTITLAAHFAAQPDDEGDEAMKHFSMIFDHIECALRIGKRPFSVDSFRPILRVDRAGNVQQRSKSADKLLNEGSALRVSDGRLVTGCRADQKRLDVAIDHALGRTVSNSDPAAIHLTSETGQPWIVIVRPVAENYGPFGQERRRVEIEILVGIPAMGRLEIVQSLFNLTARELQVVRLLANGHSIDSLSATITVSRNTTRTHLRSIFEKTKTNSQLELVQLCAGFTQGIAAEQLELA